MAAREQFAECAACGSALVEGDVVLCDDSRDLHYCDEGCFDVWYDNNLEKLKHEYKVLNVETVDF